MSRTSIVLTACLLTALARPAFAAAADDARLKRGETLLLHACGQCHATAKTGDSADREAVPFRLLSRRYPIESLEEALGEGIMSGHPDMPEFSFDAADVGAIIDYLKSIQQPLPKK
jgi:cytochrome c